MRKMPSHDLGEARSGRFVRRCMHRRAGRAGRRRAGERRGADPAPGHLPGHDDLLVPDRCDRDPSRPEHQRLRHDQDLPACREVSAAPAAPTSSTRAPPPRAMSPASSRACSRSTPTARRHAGRLGPTPPPRRLDHRRPTDLRLGRGEDDRDDAAGYGTRSAATPNWFINQMIHSLNASRESPGLPDLGDRLGPGDHSGPDRHQGREHPLAGRRRIAAHLPGLRRREGLRPERRRRVTSSPTRSRPTRRSRLRGALEDQHARRWTVRRGGATLVFGAGHLHPGGKNVDMQVARDGPDAGTIAGDDPAEIKHAVPDPTPTTTSRPARSAGTSAMEATPRDWRISLKQGDASRSTSPTTSSAASGTSRWGSCPWPGPAPSRPAAKDPFDDAAAVKAMYDEGGILTHGRLPENIDKKARNDLGLPNPRKLKSTGHGAAGRHRHRQLHLLHGRLLRDPGLPAGA